MADLRDLAERMTQLSKNVDAPVNNLKVQVATAIITDLIQSTPVDSSQALSNWQVTLDQPASSAIPAYYKGVKGSTLGASSEAALAVALAVLKTCKPGQAIYISNNLPYIQRLNEGYSTQAPAGFVERAVLIGRKTSEVGIDLNVR